MILIVDDDDAIRASLRFLLGRAGLTAEAVPGPKEAVETVRRQEPELILMDMNYSLSTTGEEGLELLRKVRILAPSTPVILMTAWGSISLAVEGMRLGAFDFITKPWDNTALLERIGTALHLNSAQAEQTPDTGRGFGPPPERPCSSPGKAARARSSSPRPSTSTLPGNPDRSSRSISEA